MNCCVGVFQCSVTSQKCCTVEFELYLCRHPFDVTDFDQSGASSCTVTVVMRDVTASTARCQKELSLQCLAFSLCSGQLESCQEPNFDRYAERDVSLQLE